MDESRGDDVLPEIPTEVIRRSKIYLAATQQGGEFPFHASQAEQTGAFAGYEFDEDINIAVGAKIGAENGPKEGQFGDVAMGTEFADGMLRDVDALEIH